MEITARTYLAAAAVAAGSLIAVVPVTSSGPAVERLFKLASADGDLAGSADALAPLIGTIGPIFADPLLNVQAEELSSNASLVSEELAYNTGFLGREVAGQSGIESLLPGSDALVLDRLTDGNSMVLSTTENLFNAVVGADNFNPISINYSPLIPPGTPGGVTPDLSGGGVGGDSAPFLSGNVGGLEGVTGNYIAAYDLALGHFLPANVLALGQAFETFNQALITDELAFNTNLLNDETAAEVAALGSNSALNGTVDRVINIDNLPISTAENSLNSLIGATDPTVSPAELTASLLTGVGGTATDPTNVFDTGDLGGVEGFFDQNAALFADIAGLNSAEITSALAPGVFDATAFTAAISGLFDLCDFSNLAPDLGNISTHLGIVFTSLF